tara:strand:+ start:500 stop:979 length:480 start_codon:yes stop_codon:yes gene_type:complete
MTSVAVSTTGAAAVQLRVSGASFQDIARTLGLSNAKAAIRIVTTELANLAEEDSDARTRLRKETNMQLDELVQSVRHKALNPADDEHLPAIRTMLAVLDRRAKLNGLDAPTELIVHNPTQTEIDNWVATMIESAMPNIEQADAESMLGIIDVPSEEIDD